MAFRLIRYLRDLLDVNADAIGDGEGLVWDSAAEEFVPGAVGGVSDHGALTGLADNDHPQYALAADVATDAELAAHLADAADAHDASAISFAPAGTIAATDVQGALEEVAAEAGASGAPTGADYLVGTAHAGLSAEIVVGTAPGGELGGTWASPTVNATHSGSSHADVQAAAEATAAAALAAHLNDAVDAHDASAISASSATLSGTGTDVQAVLEELDNLLDDHSARHENGGVDEISIAGLDGTSTELAAHLADATDAHDASSISVLDVAGDFTATDVEGVLAEIAPQLGGGSADPEDMNLIVAMEVFA